MKYLKTDILKTVKTCIAFFGILLSAFNASGQMPYFRSIQLPDEIQQTIITCLYQDNNNYMWIGTGRGLYQFDGNNFLYFPGNAGQVPLQISALYMTPDNILWIGTRKGDVYQFKGDSIQLFSPDEGNPKVSVTGFTSDRQGNLWYSTYGEGIYYYNGKHVYNINSDDGLTDNYCYTLTTDEKGRVWAATDGGISICSIISGKKVVQRLSTAQGLPDNIVLSLSADKTVIWAGMQDAGICKVDMQTLKITVLEASEKWQYGPVQSIVSGKNWLWISTERNGIISIESENGALNGNYTSSDNLNISRISHLYADKQCNYWISSGNQLLLSPGFDLLHFSVTTGSTNKNVHSILSDRNGNIWYSSDDGLFAIDKKTQQTKKIRLPLSTLTNIISLYEDDNGLIWAGTFGSGLICIHPDLNKVKIFSEFEGLSNGNILSLTGKENQMWLATLGGAYKCDISGDPFAAGSHVSFTNYGDQHFPGNNYIYSVFIDSKNRVWFGTDGKGISMLQNGRFTHFDKSQGLKSNIVYSITEDSDGDIWFSTSNAGIYRYNGEILKNYTLNDGLSDLHITSLLADKSHHLLIVHNNGVDILDTRNNDVVYYTNGVGMSDLNPDLNVCCLEGNDIVWLGTQNGIIRLQVPQDISKQQPSLQLNKISVFLGKENYIGTHEFSHSQNHISFNFNAIWFIAPTLVSYQIRLKGYDIGWIDTRNNLVTYSNLPPGSYTFEVRSSLKGNFTRSEVRSYDFIIKKPFWKTNVFILSSLLGIILIVYLFVHLREKNLKQRDALANEKLMFQFQTLRSQVNPHFLFNSFSTLISIIDEDKDVAIDYVEKLSQFFRNILEYRDKDLILLSDELQLIDTYYYLQKKRYCDNLDLTIDVDEKTLESLIPPMVLQMLVENAIKHSVISVEKPLSVKIFTDEKNITVINDLQRKKDKEPSTGIGLTNIRNRYSLLGFGDIIIEVTTDSFIVKLPIIYTYK
jgi:ligand-binding sensor domain-containing protein